MVKCDFVCDIEKLVLLLSFDPSEVFPAYTLGYHRRENYNNLFLSTKALSRVFTASIEKIFILYQGENLYKA